MRGAAIGRSVAPALGHWANRRRTCRRRWPDLCVDLRYRLHRMTTTRAISLSTCVAGCARQRRQILLTSSAVRLGRSITSGLGVHQPLGVPDPLGILTMP